MTRHFINLWRDKRGSAAIEFVFAVPVLAMLIWGIFQFGLLLEANAGMQQALGEGARKATLYPTPSDTAIQSAITSAKFGVAGGTWSTPIIDNTHAAAGSGGYKVITVSYSQPTNFLFFNGPSVTFTASKRVYLSL
jgi:Flp pilus assembly protein TadG